MNLESEATKLADDPLWFKISNPLTVHKVFWKRMIPLRLHVSSHHRGHLSARYDVAGMYVQSPIMPLKWVTGRSLRADGSRVLIQNLG